MKQQKQTKIMGHSIKLKGELTPLLNWLKSDYNELYSKIVFYGVFATGEIYIEFTSLDVMEYNELIHNQLNFEVIIPDNSKPHLYFI